MRAPSAASVRELLHGFWFLPGSVTGLGIVVAAAAVALDRRAGPNGLELAPFSGSAAAAREILAVVAGSLITVAGVTFSITLVTLQLLSSQFTPRALRGFLGQRVTQLTAGAFVGVFAYCLVVLRSVREPADGADGFVPALAVSITIPFAIGSLGLLLLFLHRTIRQIQVSGITAQIAHWTLEAVERLYPDGFGRGAEPNHEHLVRSWRDAGEPAVARPARPGYVQVVDVDRIAACLDAGDRLHVAVAPGDFVTPYDALIEVWSGRPVDLDRLRTAVVVADERDFAEDADWGLRQLADIAVRALSPGINDPTTAVTCVGYVRAVLEQLAVRAFPVEHRLLGDGQIEAVLRARSFEEHAAVLAEIAEHATRDSRAAAAVRSAADRVAVAAEEAGAPGRAELLRARA